MSDMDALKSEPLEIVIVEDSKVASMALEIILHQIGLTAIKAESGEEALKILGKRAVDLVFMDIEMPGIDGISVTRNIRMMDEKKIMLHIL
jgi:CheY-like chemotaxis protein